MGSRLDGSVPGGCAGAEQAAGSPRMRPAVTTQIKTRPKSARPGTGRDAGAPLTSDMTPAARAA
jgi:hypothetical protein